MRMLSTTLDMLGFKVGVTLWTLPLRNLLEPLANLRNASGLPPESEAFLLKDSRCK